MFWFSLHAHQQNLAIKPFCNPNIGLACVSFDKIKAVSEMMSHVSNYIVEEALLKRTQNEIYTKNIEIARAERSKLELEEEYKACQLKALQSQINPHFLL